MKGIFSMGLQLTEFQRQVADKIREMYAHAKKDFHASGNTDVSRPLILIAGAYAHALHQDLARMGQEIKHDGRMCENRGVATDDPQFYCNLHALESFLAIIGPP
jgi:hypothetical protein